jgi:DNA-binding MarR family transcriptional regulator
MAGNAQVENVPMAKVKRKAVMNSLQAAARLSRTALAARLLAHGFYAGQEQIMLSLDREDGQTPGQLANRLGVRPPTVTKTIGRLQAQGYVEKRSSEIDARQANIFLTETGRNAIRDIEKAVRKTDRIAFAGFDKSERKALFDLLARIETNLGETNVADADEDDDLRDEAAVEALEPV